MYPSVLILPVILLGLKKRRIEIGVISNIYLGSDQCHAEELLAYLSSIRPGMLILNGDLIDSRQVHSGHFPPTHFKVLKKLFSMAAAGTEIYYLLGNHDALLGKFRIRDLGHLHIANTLTLDLDGEKTWVLPGDALDPSFRPLHWLCRLGKSGYALLLRSHRLRNRIRASMERGPLSFRKYAEKHPTQKGRLEEAFEKSVTDLAGRMGYDTVVCGHTHRPSKKWRESPGSEGLYLNSGDWVDSLTALEYNFKRWKLYRYKEDKLSAFYADEDLKEMDINELIASIVARKESRKGEREGESSGE